MNREDFPILDSTLVYFDNGATTLKPKQVLNEIKDYYTKYTANIHRGDYQNSLIVSSKYEEVREKVKKLIGASSNDEIVFTSGTTDSLNKIIFGYFQNHLEKGDEVLLTKSEHASNILPWFYLAKKLGLKINYIPLDKNNKVTIENVLKTITPQTKVISIAHITNVIGDLRPIKEIGQICKEKNLKLVVDAAQSAAHTKINVEEMNIDFLALSAHKMYGPSGVGVLYGKYELLDDLTPTEYGGGMNAIFHSDGYVELREVPTRLEAGTPNIEGVLALGRAIDYIQNITIEKIEEYEHALAKYLKSELKKLPFIEVYNYNSGGTIIAFNIKGVFAQDTAVYLDKYNICVRAGNHCAKILPDIVGVGNTCRISLSLYNTKEEIDLLIKVLKNSENIWKEIL